MIQSQVSREVRLELANKILLIKAKKDLSFAQLVEGTGLSEAFVTAALLGQHPLPVEVAKMVGAKLELSDDDVLLLQTIPVRGSIEDRVPTDPTMYR
ncbi:cyanate hydratase, partial [Escherichia coli]|nr:cyanate hydratase [Escherichia coli]